MSSQSLLSPMMWQAIPGDLSLWSQKGKATLCQLGWLSLRGLEEGISVTWGTLPSLVW